MHVSIVTTREDSMEIIAELCVLLAYVENEAILEFIFFTMLQNINKVRAA